MDTALCPLAASPLRSKPSPRRDEAIRHRVTAAQRIAVAPRTQPAGGNASPQYAVMSCGARLRGRLGSGCRVVTTPLGSFLRSGGAAFCLTLRLDLRSLSGQATGHAAAA
jgi:hypothetical protein